MKCFLIEKNAYVIISIVINKKETFMINFDNGNFEAKCKVVWSRVKNLRKKTKEMVCVGVTVAMLGSFVAYDAAVAYAAGSAEGVPHAIMAGGQEVAVLQSEMDAERVIENIKTEYCGVNNDAAAMITPAVTVQEKEYVTAEYVDIDTVEEATAEILEQNATADPYFEVTVSQPMVMTKIIDHKTKVVKDKHLKKGKKKVAVKGKNGEKIVIGNQTMVNGVVEDTEIYSEEVVSKPVTEVIKKGTKKPKKKVKREVVVNNTAATTNTTATTGTTTATESSVNTTPSYVAYNPSTSAGIVGYAQAFHGVPYVYGGATPAGFDCSGFTMYVYRAFGVNLPHSSGAQAGYGVAVSASEARPGDLVVMPGHVGIYVGNGMMVHAPAPGQSVKTQAIFAACSFRRLV